MLVLAILLAVIRASEVIEISTSLVKGLPNNRFTGLKSLFLRGSFDESATYRVEVGLHNCGIIQLSSYEIECLIPVVAYFGEASYQVRVFENQIEIKPTSGELMTLQFNPCTIPIYFINPSEASYQDKIGFYGFWDEIQANLLTSAAIGDVSVTLDEVFEKIENQPSSKLGSLGKNTHGDSLVSLGDWDLELMWTGGSYTLEGERYFFRTIAVVESISSQIGSLFGGLNLTITGKGFPNELARIQVEIDGTECALQSASYYELRCLTGSHTLNSKTVYEGSAGVTKQTWYEITALETSISVDPDQTEQLATLSFPIGFQKLLSKTYGLFRAPRTGEYKFYIVSDDDAQVFLSSDSSPENKKEIIFYEGSVQPLEYLIVPKTVSSPIKLTAGEAYYLEIWHCNHGSISLFTMGVEIPGEGKFARNTMPLIQKLNQSISDLNLTSPFSFDGKEGNIGFSPQCGFRKSIHREISSQYFNLFCYCYNSSVVTMIPGYMHTHSKDLVTFQLKNGTKSTGEILSQPSSTQFWFAVPSEFLRTYQVSPQLRVWIDGRLTMCRGNCDFQYQEPVCASAWNKESKVFLSCTYLPSGPESVSVSLDGFSCEIETMNESEITCILHEYSGCLGAPLIQIKNYGETSVNINSVDLCCPDNCFKCYPECQCKSNYYWDPSLQKCLSLEKFCSENKACSASNPPECLRYLQAYEIKAYISDSYLSFVLELEVPIYTQELSCQNVFLPETLESFGSNYQCTVESSEIRVTLGYEYKILESIVIIPGALHTGNVECGYHMTYLEVSVSQPETKVKPTAILEVPRKVLIGCQDLFAESKSKGSLNHPMLYKWSVSADPQNPLLSKFNSELVEDSYLLIPKEELADSLVSVQLTVQNFLGMTDTVVELVELVSYDSLVVSFAQNYFELKTSQSLTVSVGSVFSCSSTVEPEHSWKVVSVSGNTTVFDEDAFWRLQRSTDYLHIEAYSLPSLSKVVFEVKATAQNLNGTDRLTVQLVPSEPILVLDSASGPIGVSQTLNINASQSYDPDGLELVFEWSCATDCTSTIRNPLSPVCTVEPNTLKVAQKYQFTLTLYKKLYPQLSLNRTIEITPVLEEVPSVKLKFQNVYQNTLVAHKTVKLEAITDKELSWKKLKGSSIQYETDLSSPALVIKENSLTPGETYTFQLLVESYEFTLSFQALKPPQKGTFTLEPSKGTELKTVFSFGAEDWQDTLLPLSYSFGVVSELASVCLKYKNSSNTMHSELPYIGSQTKAYSEVYNSLGAKAYQELPVSVELSTNQSLTKYQEKLYRSTTFEIPSQIYLLVTSTINRDFYLTGNFSQATSESQGVFSTSLEFLDKFAHQVPRHDEFSVQTFFECLEQLTLNPSINSLENLLSTKTSISALDLSGQELTDENTQRFLGVCENNLGEQEPANETKRLQIVEENIVTITSKVLSNMAANQTKSFQKAKLHQALHSSSSEELNSFQVNLEKSSVKLPANLSKYLQPGLYGVSTTYLPYFESSENTSSVMSFSFVKSQKPLKLSMEETHAILVIPLSNPTNYTPECQFLNSSGVWESKGCFLESFDTTQVTCKCNHFSLFKGGLRSSRETAENSNFEDSVNYADLGNLDAKASTPVMIYLSGLILLYIVFFVVSVKLDKNQTLSKQKEDLFKVSIHKKDSENNSELVETSQNAGEPDNLGTNLSEVTFSVEDKNCTFGLSEFERSVIDNRGQMLQASNVFENSVLNEGVFKLQQESAELGNYSLEFQRMTEFEKTLAKEKKPQAKPTLRIILETIKQKHDIISIFYLYSSTQPRTVRSTILFFALLSEMFFIGVFYETDADQSTSVDFESAFKSYGWTDFWVMVYSWLGMLFLRWTLSAFFNSEVKWKLRIGVVVAWIIMTYYCFSILLFSVNLSLGVGYLWLISTTLGYLVEFFLTSFVKIGVFKLISLAVNYFKNN